MRVDLVDDRFDVTFDRKIVARHDLLAAVKAIGFAPKIVTTASGPVAPRQTVINTHELPDDLQQLLRDAKTQERPILIHFTGPD